MAQPLRELTTFLPDGTKVYAVPEVAADVAESYHDVIHSLLAKATGQSASPALSRVAGNDGVSADLVNLEEDAVMAITAYVRALVR